MTPRRRKISAALLAVALLALAALAAPLARDAWRLGRTTVLEEEGRKILCVAYAPRGDALATLDAAGVLRLWSDPEGALLSERELLPAREPFGYDPYACVAFSPRGDLIAVAIPRLGVFRLVGVSGDRLLPERTLLESKPEEGPSSGSAVAFSPSGERVLLAAGAAEGVAVFETKTGARLGTIASPSRDVAFPAEARVLLASGARVVSWSLQGELIEVRPGEPSGPLLFGSEEQGKQLVSSIVTWLSPTGNLWVVGAERLETSGAAFSPTHDRLAVLCGDRVVVIPFGGR